LTSVHFNSVTVNYIILGKHFIQYVSHEPATRIDVARLREMLD